MRRLTFNGKLMAGHGLFYDATNTVTLTQLSQQLNLDCTSAFELWGIIDLLCSPLWIWNADKLQYSDGLRFPTQSPYSWPNLGSQWPICSKSRVASSCLPRMMNIHSSIRKYVFSSPQQIYSQLEKLIPGVGSNKYYIRMLRNSYPNPVLAQKSSSPQGWVQW